MRQIRALPGLALTLGLLATACGPAAVPTPSEGESQSQIANPASVFCEANSGVLEVRTAPDGGQSGFCVFTDGSECEEWSYFHGECGPAALTPSSLANAEYHSPDWGSFQLTDGLYLRPPANPGESSSAYTTRLLDPVASGDLNNDGIGDAAVFLATQNGGTGHFVELAAVLSVDGLPQNVATISLGDRVVIESAKIAAGTITIDIRTHSPTDPLCCPSQLETWKYRLEGDQLVRLQ